MEHGKSRSPGTIVFGLVLFEVRACFRVRHGLDRRGIDLRAEGHVAHLCRVVLVLPRAPQVRVREIHAIRDLLEKLFLGNLGPVIALEREQEAALTRLRAREQPLVLLRIEAAFGLKVGRVVEEGRWGVARKFAQLFVRDADAALAIFLIEQRLHDHFVERLVLDLTQLVLRQRAAVALLVLRGLLDTISPIGVENLSAVDLRDRGGGGDRCPAQEARCLGQKKAADKSDDDEQPDVFGRAPHLLQHGALLLGGMVQKGDLQA